MTIERMRFGPDELTLRDHDGNVTLDAHAEQAERDCTEIDRAFAEVEPVAWMKDTSNITTHFAKVEFDGATPLYTHPHPTTERRVIPEWQPIETAPKTGRTILLGYFNSLGNWRTLRGQWFSQQEINESWEEPEDCDGLEGWYETSVEADDIQNCWATEPTHWMPLPAAPTKKESK